MTPQSDGDGRRGGDHDSRSDAERPPPFGRRPPAVTEGDHERRARPDQAVAPGQREGCPAEGGEPARRRHRLRTAVQQTRPQRDPPADRHRRRVDIGEHRPRHRREGDEKGGGAERPSGRDEPQRARHAAPSPPPLRRSAPTRSVPDPGRRLSRPPGRWPQIGYSSALDGNVTVASETSAAGAQLTERLDDAHSTPAPARGSARHVEALVARRADVAPVDLPVSERPGPTRCPGSSAPAPGGVSRIQHRTIPARRPTRTRCWRRCAGPRRSSITAGRLKARVGTRSLSLGARPSIRRRHPVYTPRRWSTSTPRSPPCAPRSSGYGASSGRASSPTSDLRADLLAARDAAKSAEQAAGELRGELTEAYAALDRALVGAPAFAYWLRQVKNRSAVRSWAAPTALRPGAPPRSLLGRGCRGRRPLSRMANRVPPRFSVLTPICDPEPRPPPDMPGIGAGADVRWLGARGRGRRLHRRVGRPDARRGGRRGPSGCGYSTALTAAPSPPAATRLPRRR